MYDSTFKYLSRDPPNPLSTLPCHIVCWRLPSTNGINGLPCPLPSALVQLLGGTGRSWRRVRCLFPQLPTCHAAVSSDYVLLKSKVSIGQSSPTALLVPLNCPSHHSLHQEVVKAPCWDCRMLAVSPRGCYVRKTFCRGILDNMVHALIYFTPMF